MHAVISNPLLALDIQVAVSTEQVRLYLHGFHVEKAETGILLVSTDGHRMLVIHDPKGTVDGSGIVKLPLFFQREMKKLCKRAKCVLVIDEDGTARLDSADRSETLLRADKVLIDGTFPEWRRVLPCIDLDKPLVPATFNGGYLAEFGELATSDKAVTAFTDSEFGPALVKIKGRYDAFGVLMPVRSDDNATLPEWLEGDAKAEVAA